MTGREQEEFDRYLEQELGEALPRESAVGEVNPWDTPIRYIVWGVILTHIGLEFLYLQYLMPMIGVLLSYLGFRSLRRCGAGFRAAWALALAELVWQAVYLGLLVTPHLPEGSCAVALGLVHTAAGIVQLCALRAGLRRVYEQAGVAPEGDPLRSAVVWQLMCVALALSPLSHSWLAGIPMLVAFVVIVKAMFRISDGLGDAGYCLTAAPVQVSGKRFGWCYVALCAALVVGGSLWVNHPRLDAQPRPSPEMAAERQALAALGMPENVAADLSDEHVAVLEGALYVESVQEQQLLDPGEGRVSNMPENYPEGYSESAEWMDVSAVYIELPGNRMAVLNHFAWRRGAAWWGDALALLWQDEPAELVGGVLLYEKDGQSYTAAMPNLKNEMVTTTDWVFGVQTAPRITGTVSYPFGAQAQRGYTLYIIELEGSNVFGGANLIYCHRRQPVSLPYRAPEELTQGWSGKNLQNSYTNYATREYREWEKNDGAL